MRTATDEVSLCGCYVEALFTMEVGTTLGLALSLKDTVVRCRAVVATNYPQVGDGIDFIDITPEDRLELESSRYGMGRGIRPSRRTLVACRSREPPSPVRASQALFDDATTWRADRGFDASVAGLRAGSIRRCFIPVMIR